MAVNEFECKEAELDEITTMLWYLYEDYYVCQKDDLYTKANNYDRLGTYLANIHRLLIDRTEEMKNFIDKVYEARRNQKE